MQILTSAVAGHPDYILSEFAATDVSVDVWIDNIRLAGSKDAVLRETQTMDETAAVCNVSWKEEECLTAAVTYDFLGVRFNHSNSSVVPAEKLLRKIDRVPLGSSTNGVIESLGGRLLHAGAICGVSPGRFWYALKYLRRLSNALNRGTKNVDEPARVPASAQKDLELWSSAVHKPRTFVSPARCSPSFTVFVDASLEGWGGVIIDERTCEMTVLGKTWDPPEKRFHINALEALALERTVGELPVACEKGHVSLFVDNTSVVGVLRKRQCVHNRVLNDAVVHAIECLRALSCTWSVSWVRSDLNPADIPSRLDEKQLVEPHNVQEVALAVRRFLTCEGGHSRRGRSGRGHSGPFAQPGPLLDPTVSSKCQ